MQLEKIPERINKKVRQHLRYYYYTKYKSRIEAKENTAVVNLGWFLLDKDWGRYSYILCQILKFSGFKIVVKLDRYFFYTPAPYKRMLLAEDYARVRHVSAETDSIKLHCSGGVTKTIKLVFGYQLFKNKIDAYYLPYTLHPRFYQNYADNTDFSPYRNQEKKARIIFAGNFERKAYSRAILKEDFEGTIFRVEVLDHIAANFSSDSRIVYSSTKDHLYTLLDSGAARNSFIISEAKTPTEDWLPFLSKGNFYLCLPGGAMPLSHNAFEAMAVGTIPILQYKDLFYPPLEHMKNCIAYESYETLDEALEMALNMKEEELLRMQAEVIQYYDTYLATRQVIKRIKTFVDSKQETMTIAIPYLNTKRNKPPRF
jgi:hypothetical protein